LRVLWMALLLSLFAVTTHAEEWHGQARIVDGDTLAMGPTHFRLISMDAPEGKQKCYDPNHAEYDCGKNATRQLEKLIDGRDVTCAGGKRDRYGRSLVVCFAGDVNLNAEMVRSGWAVSYLGHDFDREEAEAREAKRGLWAGEFKRPADWRKNHEN